MLPLIITLSTGATLEVDPSEVYQPDMTRTDATELVREHQLSDTNVNFTIDNSPVNMEGICVATSFTTSVCY